MLSAPYARARYAAAAKSMSLRAATPRFTLGWLAAAIDIDCTPPFRRRLIALFSMPGFRRSLRQMSLPPCCAVYAVLPLFARC
jgi:hypothetical protein